MEFEVMYASDPFGLKHNDEKVTINTIKELKELSEKNHNYNLLIDFDMGWITIADDHLD